MIKMKFHWEKLNKEGSFTVETSSVEECLKIAEEEISNNNAEMTDWYVIDLGY